MGSFENDTSAGKAEGTLRRETGTGEDGTSFAGESGTADGVED